MMFFVSMGVAAFRPATAPASRGVSRRVFHQPAASVRRPGYQRGPGVEAGEPFRAGEVS